MIDFRFLGEHLGWSITKCDDLLVPLLKRVKDRRAGILKNQTTLNNFFNEYSDTSRPPQKAVAYHSARLQNVIREWKKAREKARNETQSVEEVDREASQESEEERDSSEDQKRSSKKTSRRNTKKTASNKARPKSKPKPKPRTKRGS
jgi:DNA excision repair protein ERCC-5